MNQYKKVAFYTLGCKLNFSETSTIARSFKDGGFAKVKFEEVADVYVINTCSVTENADKKCKAIVRKAKRTNPDGFIVVVGCYAQLKPDEIEGNSEVDLVLGANEKFNILEYLDSVEKKVGSFNIEEVSVFMPSYSAGDRTRTFLKVQDGCDYSCSFCTIPLARGKSRSNSIAQTLSLASEVAESSAKEVVLTGVNLGDFGVKNGESFFELIQGLDKISGVDRYRISSIEPNLLSSDIISFVAKSNRFVPHFHIPLQSGAPKILKLMRRRYQRELYTERIELIKEVMPDCCIGVDVIVGFPGESEDDFMETYNYLNELPVSYFHVFTYSERDNTKATEFGEIVPKSVRAERSKKLQVLSFKKKRAFYEGQVGKSYLVLWEDEKNDNGFMNGFTTNYVKVKKEYSSSQVNEVQEIELGVIDRDGVFTVN